MMRSFHPNPVSTHAGTRHEGQVHARIVGVGRGGFTLVELLVVVGIVLLLLVFTAPHIIGTLQSTRISGCGNELLLKFSQARQLALTENRPIEIRFYASGVEVVNSVDAYQLYYHESGAAQSHPVEAAISLGESGLAILSGDLSPLLEADRWSSQAPRPATDEPWLSRGASYLAVIFEPDGSTNIPHPLADSFITMGLESTPSGETPKDYFTIQVDPVTGKASAYRP